MKDGKLSVEEIREQHARLHSYSESCHTCLLLGEFDRIAAAADRVLNLGWDAQWQHMTPDQRHAMNMLVRAREKKT